MKQIEVSELKVGDIYYYEGRYAVVLDNTLAPRVRCIMAPTTGAIQIGDEYYFLIKHPYATRYSKVLLLARNGTAI